MLRESFLSSTVFSPSDNINKRYVYFAVFMNCIFIFDMPIDWKKFF